MPALLEPLDDRMYALLLSVLERHHRQTLDPDVRRLRSIAQAAKQLPCPSHVSATAPLPLDVLVSSPTWATSSAPTTTRRATSKTPSAGSTTRAPASGPASPHETAQTALRFASEGG